MEISRLQAVSAMVFAATMYVFPETGAADALYQWQYDRLMEPNEAQIAREASGQVSIYDGMREQDVDAALDTQFGRMDSMMFVRTAYLDEQGEVQHSDECE